MSTTSELMDQLPRSGGATLQAASLLGRRTAQLHLALSATSDLQDFLPEPFTRADLEQEAENISYQVRFNFDVLKRNLAHLDDAMTEEAGLLLSRRNSLLNRARAIAEIPSGGQKIRVHGDLHLGQMLRINSGSGEGDFIIIDFEGEPARPIVERRRKHSPLKDVAGVIRSFSYASFSAVEQFLSGTLPKPKQADRERSENWAHWWQNAATARFLSAYRETIAIRPELVPAGETAQTLLNAYLLEKALYELLYELNNRPQWLRIPIAGILSL
jgi:maltose alpha-D-glucosyltransferase/alpha-amylase